jgi:hypothetical protein
MAQGGEWSRLSNQGQAFLRVYTFSPGCTLISVGRMAQGGEWSRFRRQDNYSSLFEKNIYISHCSTIREDIVSYLTDVNERLAQMIQFILTIFFCAGWHQMIVMEDYLSPDSRDILLWWICSTICDYVSRFE